MGDRDVRVPVESVLVDWVENRVLKVDSPPVVAYSPSGTVILPSRLGLRSAKSPNTGVRKEWPVVGPERVVVEPVNDSLYAAFPALPERPKKLKTVLLEFGVTVQYPEDMKLTVVRYEGHGLAVEFQPIADDPGDE